MRNILPRIAFSFAMLLMSGPYAQAQSMLKLNILWDVKVGGTDHMTTVNPAERDLFPLHGAVAYVPSENISGTSPLYRLYNQTFDHMDSTNTSEGPYSSDGPIGFPWQSQTAVNGLTGLSRVFNSAVEHATIATDDSLAGYPYKEDFGRYGYRRWGNSAEILNTLSGGGVTIKSNTVAGGSIWSWVWNGIEFIDHWDYGREMQAAVLWFDDNNPNNLPHNPTEAGAYSPPNVQPAFKQGSPILNNHNTGLTQTTRAVPLDFDPTHWGGDSAHPVIYNNMIIGKDITLNYNGMGPVAQYVTFVYSDTAIPAAMIEMPTAYLPATFGEFYQYDAQSQTLAVSPVPNPTNCNDPGGYRYAPSSGFGGLIISNADHTAAMGVYGRSTGQGGSVQDYVFYDLRACNATSKWSAFRQLNLPAGSTALKVWVVTGSLTSVVNSMRQLYVDGAN